MDAVSLLGEASDDLQHHVGFLSLMFNSIMVFELGNLFQDRILLEIFYNVDQSNYLDLQLHLVFKYLV